MVNDLTLKFFHAPQRRLDPHLAVAAPAEGWTWPPTSVTLIAGERQVILVDTLPTVSDSMALADWIERMRLDLTTIFITHAHIDHYLGAAPLLARFPNAQLVATRATVGHVHDEIESGAQHAAYSAMFVDELVSTVVAPEVLRGDRLPLEGHEVLVKATGQSDHADSSYVHLPELAAVVVGDIAYNDVHCALMETDHERRLQWVATLREVQALDPRIVVAAHRRPDAPHDPGVLSDTIGYVEEADRLLVDGAGREEFVERILTAHPTRLNTSTVIYGAAALGLT